MIEAVLRGIILGLGLSFTTGTTFVALFNIALYKGLKSAISFVFGVFLSDAIIFSIVFYGFANFYLNSQFQSYFAVIGGVMIFLYGVRLLVSPSVLISTNQRGNLFWSFMVRGFLINLFNPMVFIFWLSISTFVSQRATPLLTASVALFSMLIADILKAYFISKFGQGIKNQFIKYFNIISALILISIGLKLIFSW